jgi:hypothetical protein
MAGARHALPGRHRPLRRVADGLCGAVVVVGIATTHLPASALGYADTPADRAAVLGTGAAVVRGELFPGGAVTGSLTVSNSTPYDAQVTDVAFDVPMVDAQHPGCAPSGIAFRTASPLPLLPGGQDPTSRVIAFTATMDRAVGDACQGATFTSTYRVSARPA